MKCAEHKLVPDGGSGWYSITCEDCEMRWTGGSATQTCTGCSAVVGVTYAGKCDLCEPLAKVP